MNDDALGLPWRLEAAGEDDPASYIVAADGMALVCSLNDSAANERAVRLMLHAPALLAACRLLVASQDITEAQHAWYVAARAVRAATGAGNDEEGRNANHDIR